MPLVEEAAARWQFERVPGHGFDCVALAEQVVHNRKQVHTLLQQDVALGLEHEVADVAALQLAQRHVVHDRQVFEPTEAARGEVVLEPHQGRVAGLVVVDAEHGTAGRGGRFELVDLVLVQRQRLFYQHVQAGLQARHRRWEVGPRRHEHVHGIGYLCCHQIVDAVEQLGDTVATAHALQPRTRRVAERRHLDPGEPSEHLHVDLGNEPAAHEGDPSRARPHCDLGCA